MKFDKFGIFPKTPSLKSTTNNLFDLSSILKLIPSLLSKKADNPPKTDHLSQTPTNENAYFPNNSKAYSDFLQKHDAFVKSVNQDKK